MSKVFKKVIVEVALVTTLLGVTACATTTANSRLDNNGDTRRVDNVLWNNKLTVRLGLYWRNKSRVMKFD